ncbi:radical SAM protein [Thermosphaera chiliense]|uniref:Radical SAM protein n=1 Tax=Thermosphaera chiliense TaxID=3402707 RepID=A0A7M1URV4_9CREN|nr:radical SAM protein [Thermosphaera aggregans]QOR94183.1 radical SAM protein [Thermosphaera aggregans]
MAGYNPIVLSEAVKNHVCRTTQRGEERKYYRFRGGKWYGGIATGDVVGCNLRCGFCWSWRFSHVFTGGWFESAESAFQKILEIASKHNYEYVRLSGGEPTISRSHLLKIIELFSETHYTFILETNGLLIGYDPDYARDLAEFSNLVVRVSLKGASEEEFHALTGADPSFFRMQLKSLENLLASGFKPCREVYPAVMLSFSTPGSYNQLKRELSMMSQSFLSCIDEEYVILYPHVKEIMKRRGLKPKISYTPEGVPDFMI